MPFANGPLTSILAAFAGAAGTGIVLGGVAAGVLGMLASWDREGFDFKVRAAGYWGGVIGLGVLLFERIVL